MANSYNGWEAIPSSGSPALTVIEPVPNRKFRVRSGDVATVFDWFIRRFHSEVEPIDGGVLDDWSYAYRKGTGTPKLSNHASGTAVDLNAEKHPWNTRAEQNFSKSQIDAVTRILVDARVNGQDVIRWISNKDPMHFEINYWDRGGSAANVAALAARIRGGEAVQPSPEPAQQVTGSREPRPINWNNPDTELVKITQEIVGANVDGVRGKETGRKVLASQRALGVSNPDTLFGPKHALAFLLSVGNMYKSKPDSEMNRAAVKLVQYIGGVNQDGSFGDGTDVAVKEMQVWAGLTPDGNVGDDTKRKIVR